MSVLRPASLLVALTFSGAAALIYQAAWGRMLHRVFGVGDLAIATVLAGFFLGLGLGAWGGGRIANRLKRPAFAYAAIEILIALYAVLSLFLIPNVHSLYASIGADAGFFVLTSVRLALAMLILLPPTILMGATLPVLIRVIAGSSGWSHDATKLYVTNTLGAMMGAGLTGLYLVPTFGTRVTILVAAGSSLVAAAIILTVWGRAVQTAAPLKTPAAALEPEEAPPSRIWLAVTLAATAGIASLAGEVIWTRVLRIIVHGTTAAFSAMLVNYLFGIAVGSWIAGRALKRGANPLRLFGSTQLLLAVLGVMSMMLAPQLPRILGLISEDHSLHPHNTLTILALSAILLLPMSLVLGTSIPLAWKIAGGGVKEASGHAGKVLAANTLGGLVGALAAGFFLVPYLGVSGSVVTVVSIHAFTAAVALRAAAQRTKTKIFAIVAPALLLGLLFHSTAAYGVPDLQLPFLLHARNDASVAILYGPPGTFEDDISFLYEGRNTTVSVIEQGDLLRLYNDGRPESGFGGGEPGFGAELATLGALPGLFADTRERAMVVGLGGGHTATMALAGGFERVDVVELEEGVVEAARLIHEKRGKAFPLDDERAHLIVDDARAQLVLAPADSFDAVMSQPSHPWLAGSSALYTTEFFHEVKRALRDGGVFSLWVNLFRVRVPHLQQVVRTLTDVFPHTQAYVVDDSSFILCASEQPMELDARVAERIRSQALRPFLEPLGLDHIVDFLAVRELGTEGMLAFGANAEPIVDDLPALEFELAGLSNDSGVTLDQLDRAMLGTPWISNADYHQIPETYRVDTMITRLSEVSARPIGLMRVDAARELVVVPQSDADYLRGAIGDARGNLAMALGGYDTSTDPRAATAADDLRHDERMHYSLLRVALSRNVDPETAEPVLSSAVAVRNRELGRRALELADRIGEPADAPIADVVRAWVNTGCRAVLADDALDAMVNQDEYVALLAADCAFRANERDRATAFLDIRTRLRRVLGSEEYRLGTAARDGGNNGAAMRHFRRALRANPSHGGAASTLAYLLDENQRPEEAAAVLRAAVETTEGLPNSSSLITQAAEALMIDLTPQETAPAVLAPEMGPPPALEANPAP